MTLAGGNLWQDAQGVGRIGASEPPADEAQTAEGLGPRTDDRWTARLTSVGETTPRSLASRSTRARPSLQPLRRPRREVSDSSGVAVGTSSSGHAISRTRVEARACPGTFFTAGSVTSPVRRPSRSWVGNVVWRYAKTNRSSS